MKKFSIIFILVMLSFHLFSQEYLAIDTVALNCYYSYDFQQDSTSKYSMKSQEMILQIGKYVSKFTASHRIYSDSIIKENSVGTPTAAGFQKIIKLVGGTIIHSYCKSYVYKNYPEQGDITFTDYINKKYLKVTEKLNFNWEIHEIDSVLNGYNCLKATTSFAGRNYEAWFTMDIPISDGPYKFHGLPGLIVKIYDTSNEHKYELVKVEKLRYIKPIYILDRDYIQVTSKEYLAAFNYGSARLVNRIQHQDGIIMEDDESRARALNNAKSRNNFIEKY